MHSTGPRAQLPVGSVAGRSSFGVTWTCSWTLPAVICSSVTPSGSGSSIPSVVVPDATTTRAAVPCTLMVPPT